MLPLLLIPHNQTVKSQAHCKQNHQFGPHFPVEHAACWLCFLNPLSREGSPSEQESKSGRGQSDIHVAAPFLLTFEAMEYPGKSGLGLQFVAFLVEGKGEIASLLEIQSNNEQFGLKPQLQQKRSGCGSRIGIVGLVYRTKTITCGSPYFILSPLPDSGISGAGAVFNGLVAHRIPIATGQSCLPRPGSQQTPVQQLDLSRQKNEKGKLGAGSGGG